MKMKGFCKTVCCATLAAATCIFCLRWLECTVSFCACLISCCFINLAWPKNRVLIVCSRVRHCPRSSHSLTTPSRTHPVQFPVLWAPTGAPLFTFYTIFLLYFFYVWIRLDTKIQSYLGTHWLQNLSNPVLMAFWWEKKSFSTQRLLGTHHTC